MHESSTVTEGSAGIQWTNEQYPALTSLARLVKILAFAGGGKTSTLVGYAEAHPADRMLYICYNKSIEVAAKGRFPANVTCRTSHGLAYGQIGSQYQHKLTNNLRLTDIARAANTQNWALARDIFGTLTNFMASADASIHPGHFPRFKDVPVLTSKHQQQVDQALSAARRLWGMMIDLQDTRLHITHDAYLKLWCLGEPNLSHKYTTILADEWQDTNPVIASLVQAQVKHGVKVVVVGDPHQMLYRFRGAIDALDSPWLADAEIHRLTQSFRFGPAVAHVANMILSLKGERVQLQGMGPRSQVKKHLPADLPHRTFLHRTVAGVIENGLSLLAGKHKLFWVGGINSYSLRDLEDLFWFSKGRAHWEKIQGYRLRQDYQDFEQYKEIAEASQDTEMLRSIKIIKTYPDLPDRINALRRATVNDELEATVTLATAHKAKGLEWDNVQLYEDFSTDPLDPELDEEKRVDELNLLYVAVTRAMRMLAINSTVLAIMQDFVNRRDGRRGA